MGRGDGQPILVLFSCTEWYILEPTTRTYDPRILRPPAVQDTRRINLLTLCDAPSTTTSSRRLLLLYVLHNTCTSTQMSTMLWRL